MSEEPLNPEPETALQRIEDEVKAIPAETEALLASVHAHFDAFVEEVRANVSTGISTVHHNLLMDMAARLRSQILGLF
jgi:ElaB/YqjD/DUF883 family membrane-anchored ribosome-binding protein